MRENKNPIVVRKSKEDLVKKSLSTFQDMIAICPNPTQDELRKLLAIQGTILNQVGLDLLFDCREDRKAIRQMKIALEALAASRSALVSAARIAALLPEEDLLEDRDEIPT